MPQGGYVIVDDYYAVPVAKQAVHEFLDIHDTNVTMTKVDFDAVYWKKEQDIQVNQTWYQEFNKRRKPHRRRLLRRH